MTLVLLAVGNVLPFALLLLLLVLIKILERLKIEADRVAAYFKY